MGSNVVKYEPSAFFFKSLQLAHEGAHAVAPVMRARSIRERTRFGELLKSERRRKRLQLIHESQSFRKKSDGSYLMTPMGSIWH